MDMFCDGVYQRTVYATLGRVGAVPLSDVIATAVKFVTLIKQGIDPTAEGYVPPGDLTVRYLMEHYAGDLAARGKSQRFQRDVVRRAELYLTDWLDRPFVRITKADVRCEAPKDNKGSWTEGCQPDDRKFRDRLENR